MKFKISWGIGIAVVYIAFVLIRLVIIAVSEKNSVDLVSDDYYEREVRYEQQMRAISHTQSLPESLRFSLINKNVRIVFPEYFRNRRVDGTILFFRPSDTKQDIKIPLRLNDSLQQDISVANLMNGYWKIQIDWKSDTTQFFQEFPLYLR